MALVQGSQAILVGGLDVRSGLKQGARSFVAVHLSGDVERGIPLHVSDVDLRPQVDQGPDALQPLEETPGGTSGVSPRWSR